MKFIYWRLPIAILCPAINGEHQKFGGTSGAAPLVTGGLSGFEWLSGYHPSPEESKLLLEKTAIPTLHSHEQPPQNGVGLLNAYKLGRVGKRLKEKCANKGSSCFKEEIQNPKTYQFEVKKGIEEKFAAAFPECGLRRSRMYILPIIPKSPGKPQISHTISIDKEDKEAPEYATCEEKEKAFKELRQAVLLNPERKDLWKNLSCVYKNGGFSANGEALDRIALATDSKEAVLDSLQGLLEKTGILVLKFCV